MIILGIHSSSCGCAVAISENANILAANYSIEVSMQAEHLLPMIQKTITQAKIEYKHINYLAVTQGPGSFTGIRIALSTALGIIIAAPHINPIVISDLEVIRFLVKQQVKDIDTTFAIINAYRNKVYIQRFGIEDISKPVMIDDTEVAGMVLDASSNRSIACAGSGLKIVYDKITSINSLLPDNIYLLPRHSYYDAKPICRLAYHLINSKSPYSTKLQPLYVYDREFKHWHPDPSIEKKYI